MGTDWIVELRKIVGTRGFSPERIAELTRERTAREECTERRRRFLARRALLERALLSVGVDQLLVGEVAAVRPRNPRLASALRGHVEAGRSVLLHGGTGTMKSTMACRMVRWRLVLRMKHLSATENLDLDCPADAGKVDFAEGVRWCYAPEFFEGLRNDAAPEEGPSGKELREACSRDLLVLDDLGTERVTTWVGETLARLIHRRLADSLPTILTSNSEPTRLVQRYGSQAKRLHSRLLGGYTLVEFSGPDLRRGTSRR